MEIRSLALASDHAGVALKAALMENLRAAGYEVRDLGPDAGTRVDYPDYAARVASSVRDGQADAGILMCGTGIGMSMAANKLPGIRAALVHDPFTAEMARQHNDANVLVLGARLMAAPYAWLCVEAWLKGTFEARHQPRLDKIARLELGAGEG